jgi:hypothetical protein
MYKYYKRQNQANSAAAAAAAQQTHKKSPQKGFKILWAIPESVCFSKMPLIYLEREKGSTCCCKAVKMIIKSNEKRAAAFLGVYCGNMI